MADPVSWLLIEPGWRVLAADGEDVGKVEQVVADSDIFSGLSVATSLLKTRFVPAEVVREIRESEIELTASSDEVDRLGEYEPPPEP